MDKLLATFFRRREKGRGRKYKNIYAAACILTMLCQQDRCEVIDCMLSPSIRAFATHKDPVLFVSVCVCVYVNSFSYFGAS